MLQQIANTAQVENVTAAKLDAGVRAQLACEADRAELSLLLLCSGTPWLQARQTLRGCVAAVALVPTLERLRAELGLGRRDFFFLLLLFLLFFLLDLNLLLLL